MYEEITALETAFPPWAAAFAVLLCCLYIWFFAKQVRGFGGALRQTAAVVRSVPSFLRPVLCLFAFRCLIIGSVKTNSPSGPPLMSLRRETPNRSFTPDQFQAGFALARTEAVSAAAFEKPSNAVVYAPWATHGAFRDYFWITGDAPLFRLGTNAFTAVRVSTHGVLAFEGTDAKLAPFPKFMSVLPAHKWQPGRASRLWHCRKASGATVITWENFLVDRHTDRPVSVQAELDPDGDFVFRYSGQTAVTNCAFCYAENNGVITDARPRPNTALFFASLAGLDPEVADCDGDGLADVEEVVLGTDPRRADTDGDGLTDAEEAAAGLGPALFDTDGDGLPDGIDPQPTVADAVSYGICDAWINASFPNAAEVRTAGYDNYIDAILAGDDGARFYTVTAAVTALDDAGRAFIRVGPWQIVVDAAGEYRFILERGLEYPLAFSPQNGVTFTASAAETVITPPTRTADGSVVLWPTRISVTPSSQHYHSSGESHGFSASFDDAGADVAPQWSWACADPYVSFRNASGNGVEIVWDWPDAEPYRTWFSTEVQAVGRIGEWAATNTFRIDCGAHDTPEMHLTVSMPPAFFVSNAVEVVTTFTSDIPTNGTVAVTDGSFCGDILAAPFPKTYTVPDGSTHCRWTETIFCDGHSTMRDDIVFFASFNDGELEAAATATAVEVTEIEIPSAPPEGLAVLVGTDVPMRVVAHPDVLEDARCNWSRSTRFQNGRNSFWQCVAEDVRGGSYTFNMSTGGVFRISASVTLAGETKEVHYLRKTYDSNIDEPDVVGDGYVGVASTPQQIHLRNVAVSHLNETEFAFARRLPSFYGYSAVGMRAWKCNAFVAYCAREAGLTVPVKRKTSWHGVLVHPPFANDWASGIGIAGWSYLSPTDLPEPGLVVGHPNYGNSGHCGIVDFDGRAVAAGEDNVNRRFTKFLDGTSGFNRWIGE